MLRGLAFLVLITLSARTLATEARVPLSLDYPLLQYLVESQLFGQPSKSRDILNDANGCSRIELSDPKLAPQGEYLEILTSVNARIGVPLMGQCREILHWRGGATFHGMPVVMPGGRTLRLEPRQIWLTDNSGNRMISGPLWDAANNNLRGFFSGFTLDLSPHVDALAAFLPEVLPQHSVQQLQASVDSLRVASVAVTQSAVSLTIQFQIAAVPELPMAAAALSDEELRQFEERWHMMDALLVSAVKHYASVTRLLPLRTALLDILIDSRYRLQQALTASAAGSRDEVRSWFIDSWQSLNPVVRSIALEQEGQAHWLWFSVLTATDALYALDQLGPSIGLDISTDGLRRLARLINSDVGDELLRYSEDIDPQLQQLWQEQLQSAKPAQSWRFDFSLFPAAHAGAPRKLNLWVPGTNELDDYLPAIASLLEATGSNVVKKKPLASNHQQLFEKLVYATAWQESCWRQYEVRNKRIEPLRSSSGDVGLMQVNERVWRGFYNIQKLRWDIEYNGNAGAEILLNYLVVYALKRGEHKQAGGFNNLARASYSAYNGGPSQVSRYRKANVPAAQRKVDKLFWEKFQQVDAGNKMNVARCLGREPDSLKTTATLPASVKSAPLQNEAWVRAQPAHNFTLQLATFSSRAGALKFMRQQSLSDAHIYTSSGKLFVVLRGSYSSRQAAQPAQKKFRQLKPWLRQFRDLR